MSRPERRPRINRLPSPLPVAAVPSPLVFDDVQAARLVREIDEAALVHGDVVGERRLLAIARLGNEMTLLLGKGGIVDVDDTKPGAEPGDVEQAILVHPLAQ